MRRLCNFLVVLAVLAWIAPANFAAGDPPTEHFPPNPQVEWQSLRLDLRVADMNDAAFDGKATYAIAAAGQRVDSLRLDAGQMEILSVVTVGATPRKLEWSHDGGVLQIRLAEPIGPRLPGQEAATLEFAIEYRVRDPHDGMKFSCAIPGVDGRPGVAAEIHTQGEPQSNHHWFPVHDFPNIRLATQMVVDVPAGVSVSSNGRLVERRSVGNREIWHWMQEKPHVPYLVSMVAGNFQRTELPAPISGVPMSVWTRPDQADMVRATYANTDRMMGCFERVFGQRYPWDRYDQLVVRNFSAGGMENTSATTMNSGALLDATALLEGDLDGLISHELCHQWMGDLITCNSWEHLWLNEGWATYGTALWMEERDGADSYYDQMLGSAAVADRDTGLPYGEPARAPQAMCSRVYGTPGETFRRAANPYPKGASILHMLRRLLTDEIFFRGVRLYTERFAGKTVQTHDFRGCLEEVSGRSLEQFFTQWCDRAGCPVVKVASQYDAATRLLTMTVEQKNRGGGQPMSFDLPVVIRTSSSERTIRIAVSSESTQRQVELDGPPTMIAVDPMLDVLKVLEVTHAQPLLIEQMKHGPTSASRRQAIRALRANESPEVRDALAAVVRDPKARWTLRVEAVEALAAWGSPQSRALTRELFDELVAVTLGKSAVEAAAVCHPQLRATLTDAVGVAPFEQALPRLQSVLAHDAGYAPRISALAAVARMGGVDFPQQREAILQSAEIRAGIDKMLAITTPNERVRSGALDAIGSLNHVEFRDRVSELAALGHHDRLRPSAIASLASLAPPPSDAVGRARTVRSLIELLDDPEPRARDAAGDALVSMQAREALRRMDAIAQADRNPRVRESAAEWAKKIRAATAVPATAVPATAVPATAIPATAVPATAIPATAVPATAVPATAIPATAIPATAIPATAIPATAIPATAIPATAIPATAIPATAVPATAVPATAMPTTAVPATAVPATAVPATAVPATAVAPKS